ncbi:MAG: glutamate 5-kinase [Polyangiaceae bacterium]|nr:glutamate 5-kinase [Polyangiaceae bacterium]
MSDTRHAAAKGSSPNATSALHRASWRRVVVKIGSSSLAGEQDGVGQLAEQVARLSRERRSFVIVSSGAIAIGCERLGYRTRPKDMGKLQAAAAAGQSVLMRRYDEALAQGGLVAAQVLLTHGDLADRERLNNAREALGALIDAGAVPIVNENDTVATEEIRFGDNDQLAAMVVPLVGADLLVLLTDVDGVLDDRGRRIREMTDEVALAQLSNRNGLGSGGMASKVSAARKASQSGASVVIAPARRPGVLGEILAGKDVGTRFRPTSRALRARKHWIAYTLRPRGDVLLDAGAVRAVSSGRSSLLPVGVLGVRGEFNPGDAVRLVAADGSEVARGLTRLGAMDVARAAGKKGRDLELVFGAHAAEIVIVHKDDLVTELADKQTS